MTKKDLLEKIEILEYNSKSKDFCIEVQRQRLEKVTNHLKEQGYEWEQINEILRLPCEMR